MNRLLFPLIALAMAAIALFSFVAVSLMAFAGLAVYTVARNLRRIGRQAGGPSPSAGAEERGSGINRVWNDGRGTIIDM